MRGFSVIQGGRADGPDARAPRSGSVGCAEAVDRILRRRLAALRRPLALVGAEPAPAPGATARPVPGPRRPARPVAGDVLVGVRP